MAMLSVLGSGIPCSATKRLFVLVTMILGVQAVVRSQFSEYLVKMIFVYSGLIFPLGFCTGLYQGTFRPGQSLCRCAGLGYLNYVGLLLFLFVLAV